MSVSWFWPDWRATDPDDPPEYDPGAEAQRIAGEFADAAADQARDEAIEPLHQWRPARDLDGEPLDAARGEAREARNG